MEYLVFKIFGDIVLGYTLSTFLFLIFYRFSIQLKYLKSQYLDISNKLILILSATFYTIFCCILIINKLLESDNIIKSYSFQNIIFTTLATVLIPMLFIFKKFRQNYFTIILVMLTLVIFTNYEKGVIVLTNLYRDYLPSSWTVDYTTMSYFSPFIVCIFYFLAVILVIRIKKTNG